MNQWKPKDNRITCKKCKSHRYKIVHTHGVKSKGYKVCKDCKSVIK
jgi:Zn finger protein HypA/HybF involved in hydrogenase expression